MDDKQHHPDPPEEDVEGHMRPDEASMFGTDQPGVPRPPQKARVADDGEDVGGHGSASG